MAKTGGSHEFRGTGREDGTAIDWSDMGIFIRQPDPTRLFTPAQAEAFGQAIIQAAADAREAGAVDGVL